MNEATFHKLVLFVGGPILAALLGVIVIDSYYPFILKQAPVVELADTPALEAGAVNSATGSSPVGGTGVCPCCRK